MAKEKTYRRIAAVKTSADILLNLAEHKGAASAADIAASLGLPVGTVYSHLVTLEDAGFVRDVGSGWVPGMALAKIWARAKSGEEAKLYEAQRNLAELSIG